MLINCLINEWEITIGEYMHVDKCSQPPCLAPTSQRSWRHPHWHHRMCLEWFRGSAPIAAIIVHRDYHATENNNKNLKQLACSAHAVVNEHLWLLTGIQKQNIMENLTSMCKKIYLHETKQYVTHRNTLK